MKKKIVLFIIMLIFPLILNAETFNIPYIEVSMDLNEDWLKFDRNTIIDNELLKKTGITEEEFKNRFEKNNLYLNALSFNNDNFIELFVRFADNNLINNLSNYGNLYVKRLAKKYANRQNQTEYRILETDYKFIVINSKDGEKYVKDYYTVVNGRTFVFTFRSGKIINDHECDKIIKTINFKINPDLAKEKSKFYLYRDFLLGIVVGIIVGGIISYKKVKKINKKDSNKEEKDTKEKVKKATKKIVKKK